MADQMKPYRITIEMDTNGWWFVDVPDVPGAHTDGQTLAAARRNAREVIALMEHIPDDVVDTIELDERIILPREVQSTVDWARTAREEAERAAAAARSATDDALAAIEKYLPDLGLRDQAELVGLSYQRVAQLRPGTPRRGRRAHPTKRAG